MTNLPKYVSDRIDLDDVYDKLVTRYTNGKYVDKDKIIKLVISKSDRYDKTKNANPLSYFATMLKHNIIIYLKTNKDIIRIKMIKDNRENKIAELFA